MMENEKTNKSEKKSAGSCPPAMSGYTCFLIWDEDFQYTYRSRLIGRYVYDMKCNRCLSFVGVSDKPSKISANHCKNCGAKIIKDDSLYSLSVARS